MRGYDFGQVLPCQASVLQQGVNFVRFNLEAFVARGFFAQVANQEVGEGCLVPLGVVDEKALPLLAFEARLDGFSFGLTGSV